MIVFLNVAVPLFMIATVFLLVITLLGTVFYFNRRKYTPMTALERKMLRRRLLILYILLFACIAIIIVGSLILSYENQMEEAIALTSARLGRDNDEITRIQITQIYEKGRPDTLKDAADALWSATAIADDERQDEIEVAVKLIGLNKLTGADYADITRIIREFAHNMKITEKQALELFWDYTEEGKKIPDEIMNEIKSLEE